MGKQPLALGPKVLMTLMGTLSNVPARYSRNATARRVWPEGFVEGEQPLRRTYVLRKSSGALLAGLAAIETVPRRGYRFCCGRASTLWRPSARFFAASITAATAAVAMVLGCEPAWARYHRQPGSLRAGCAQQRGARMFALGTYYWKQRTKAGVQKASGTSARRSRPIRGTRAATRRWRRPMQSRAITDTARSSSRMSCKGASVPRTVR